MTRQKRRVRGVIVKTLTHECHDRGMTLMDAASRCVKQGELHELVTTDQLTAACGDRIDRVGFLGFVEIVDAGVIEIGDEVVVNHNHLGNVVGFDECHFPNHYNVLIGSNRLWTGDALKLEVDKLVVFS